jgi:hypothetical protein
MKMDFNGVLMAMQGIDSFDWTLFKRWQMGYPEKLLKKLWEN